MLETTYVFEFHFPNYWQPYWWRAKAYKKMGQTQQAKNCLQELIKIKPDLIQAYEALEQAQRQSEPAEVSLKTAQILANLPTSNRYHKLTYIKYLLALTNPLKALREVKILEGDDLSYQFALALIYQELKNYNEAYLHYKYIFENYVENEDIIEIVLSARETFKRLKKFDEYSTLIEHLKKDFPNNMAVLWSWCDLETMRKSWIEAWQTTVYRLEESLQQHSHSLDLIIPYTQILLHIEDYDKLEKFLTLQMLLGKYPNNIELNKVYCISAHHQKEWHEAEKRLRNFYEKFPNDKSLFFYYANVLYNLDRTNEIKDLYSEFNKERFWSTPEFKELDKFQLDLLTSQYQNLKLPKSDIDCGKMDKVSDIKPTIKQVVHNKENEVLVILFDGLQLQLDSQNWFNEVANLDLLNQSVEVYGKLNDYDGFANNTKDFNFLLVRDFSSSYLLTNFQDNIKALQKQIDEINPKYIVCMGSSSGGFSSILYAQYLKANLVFAFMPRLQALFFEDAKRTHRELQINFELYEPELIDIGYMQHKQGGFKCKTYVSLCENEPSDVLGSYTLNKSDPNLHITYFHGDVHALLDYVGAKNIYTEVTNIILKELDNKFDLPLQKNIFSNIKGYKYRV